MTSYQINGQELVIKRDAYTWLWNVKYVFGGGVWSGPYKTKKEAFTKLEGYLD